MLELDQDKSYYNTNIKIVGVGGGGGNAVNTMIRNGMSGVEFIAANTDSKDLKKSSAKIKLQLGKKITKGLGTGANPEVGKKAAEESEEEIRTILDNTEMVFIAAGMGGGTGTGAAPVIASIARDMGILTMAIVTKPFGFEGSRRKKNTEYGLEELRKAVDTLIVIPNEKLKEIYSDISIVDAFTKADNILSDAAKSVSDMINLSGYISVDFSDVKSVMANMGYALMGTAICEGEDRAINAAKMAISNPLLADISLDGCKAILINVTAGLDMKMSEFDEVSQVITNETGTDANIIIGLVIDKEMTEKISVTIVATGLHSDDEKIVNIPELNNKSEKEKHEQLDIIFDRIRQADTTSPEIVQEKHSFEKSKVSTTEKIEIPTFMRRFD